jgi:lysosomal alpha-mannosidase
VIRLYKDSDYLEFDWIVGPIPVKSGNGLEVISLFDSNLKSDATFYTDSNGRQTLRRKRGFREAWKITTTESVASNYHPITSWIFIRDNEKDLQLTLLTDRSQGGSSINDGSIELMVHRRLLFDDDLGMGEALNEPGVDGRGLIVRGKHILLIGDIKKSVRQMKSLSKIIALNPILTFYESKINSTVNGMHFIGIQDQLPENIHLMTLEAWDDRVLIRLENIFETNEDASVSQVSLNKLFSAFEIIDAKEMTLSANQEIRSAESKRFKWNSKSEASSATFYDLNQISKHSF